LRISSLNIRLSEVKVFLNMPHYFSLALLLAPLTVLGVKQHEPPDLYYTEKFNRDSLLYAAFGDSYTTGISPGNWNWDEDSWPMQLVEDPDRSWSGNRTMALAFGAVEGATIEDIPRQIDKVQNAKLKEDGEYVDRDLTFNIATATMGGNDLGFESIIKDCLFQFWTWGIESEISEPCSDCAISLREGHAKMHSPAFQHSYLDAIEWILEMPRAKRNPNFKLYVVNYPTLFNAETTPCDDMKMMPLSIGRRQRLTRELRRELNRIIDDGNNMVRGLLAKQKYPNVEYVDVGPLFDGHRYCEEGAMDYDEMADKAWFYEASFWEMVGGNHKRFFHQESEGHTAIANHMKKIIAKDMSLILEGKKLDPKPYGPPAPIAEFFLVAIDSHRDITY
jgi:GDSL-like lipase/acylhydrolase family protein